MTNRRNFFKTLGCLIPAGFIGHNIYARESITPTYEEEFPSRKYVYFRYDFRMSKDFFFQYYIPESAYRVPRSPNETLDEFISRAHKLKEERRNLPWRQMFKKTFKLPDSFELCDICTFSPTSKEEYNRNPRICKYYDEVFFDQAVLCVIGRVGLNWKSIEPNMKESLLEPPVYGKRRRPKYINNLPPGVELLDGFVVQGRSDAITWWHDTINKAFKRQTQIGEFV